MGCHSLLPGIFLTQGSNLSLLYLLHWQSPGKPPYLILAKRLRSDYDLMWPNKYFFLIKEKNNYI